MEFIKELIKNLDWQFISGVIAIVSIILAVYFYFNSKQKSSIKCFVIHNKLIAEKLSKLGDLKIFYKNNEVSDLVQTKITLNNTGNTTINFNDIASTEPLKINIKNPYKILDVLEINQSETCNKFNLSPCDEKSVMINFEYFSPKDKVVITILHTNSDLKGIDVTGKIKGGKFTVKEIDDFELTKRIANIMFESIMDILIENIKMIMKR